MSQRLARFLEKWEKPVVFVGTLLPKDREAVVSFLLKLNAPTYLEGVSGLREDPRLAAIRVTSAQDLWSLSSASGYTIDAVLRIGGVPTLRPWRDLEDQKQEVAVFSVTHLSFAGLSRGEISHADLAQILSEQECAPCHGFEEWLKQDKERHQVLLKLIEEEPEAEASLVCHLSRLIPESALIYLGNSLPVREWDLAASYEVRHSAVYASRGLNGIDGQVSTFLGMAEGERENWGIFGDLTMLYDLAAPWILPQLSGISVNLVVINNSGGKIFSRMFPQVEFQNRHSLSMEPIAKQWGMDYAKGISMDGMKRDGNTLIELIPDEAATQRFWKSYAALLQSAL